MKLMPLFLYHDLTGITIQRKVAPDIRKKLQKLDYLGEKSSQDLTTSRESLQHPRDPRGKTSQSSRPPDP